eukprot:Skav210580  [mRNA]  locus=scaffold3272:79349:90411:+ [translate_table: standard]
MKVGRNPSCDPSAIQVFAAAAPLPHDARRGHNICLTTLSLKPRYGQDVGRAPSQGETGNSSSAVALLLEVHGTDGPHQNGPHRTLPRICPQRAGLPESLQEVTDIPTWQRLESLLNKSTKRHDDSQCLCLHGSSTFKLQKAYQVKHRQLWQRYQRCLRNIHDKHKRDDILPDKIDPPVGDALAQFAKEIEVDPAKTECLLFHGTRSFDLAQQIAEEGFDNRIALSSGLYGKGTYFAAQTCKSAQYAILNGNGTKASFSEMGTMIVARVAIGDPFYTPGPLQDPRALHA